MISDLKLFDIYGAMARHAAERQKVSATNISNADTPGFKALVVEPFEQYVHRLEQSTGSNDLSASIQTHATATAASPNGNTVLLEEAIFESAQASGQHSLAMTVYSKSLDLLRASLGGRR